MSTTMMRRPHPISFECANPEHAIVSVFNRVPITIHLLPCCRVVCAL